MGGPKRLDCGLSETVIAWSMTILDESSYQKALTSFKDNLTLVIFLAMTSPNSWIVDF